MAVDPITAGLVIGAAALYANNDHWSYEDASQYEGYPHYLPCARFTGYGPASNIYAGNASGNSAKFDAQYARYQSGSYYGPGIGHTDLYNYYEIQNRRQTTVSTTTVRTEEK